MLRSRFCRVLHIAAYTHCLQARWTFVSRTIPGAGPLFKDLEATIRDKFLPALLHKSITDAERELLALPARFGGLGIFNPCEKAPESTTFSQDLCAPLIALILKQADSFEPVSLMEEQKIIRNMQDAAIELQLTGKIEEIESRSSRELRRHRCCPPEGRFELGKRHAK